MVDVGLLPSCQFSHCFSVLGDLFVEVGELPDGLSGFLQLLFLGGVYGMVLM